MVWLRSESGSSAAFNLDQVSRMQAESQPDGTFLVKIAVVGVSTLQTVPGLPAYATLDEAKVVIDRLVQPVDPADYA